MLYERKTWRFFLFFFLFYGFKRRARNWFTTWDARRQRRMGNGQTVMGSSLLPRSLLNIIDRYITLLLSFETANFHRKHVRKSVLHF